MNATSYWDECLLTLKDTLSEQQFNSWIKPLSLEVSGTSIVITTPNTFSRKIVLDRFSHEFERIACSHFSNEFSIEFKVKESNDAVPAPSPQRNLPASINENTEKGSEEGSSAYLKSGFLHPKNNSRMNDKLTFETFVTGSANQLAFAAAKQIASLNNERNNLLFIYGGNGLGKTHLIQGIGNQILQQEPSTNVCYMPATSYLEDLRTAGQLHKWDEFKRYYHSLDVLLMDDIQFFSNKPGTQQQFFDLFNALIDSNKRVILTCDTLPKDIPKLENRLISRFGWGLTVPVEPPELEMRVAILERKSQIAGYKLPVDVAFFIAKYIASNVRELEGALLRVEAYSRFNKTGITIESAQTALDDIIIAQSRSVSIENIQKTVADYYRIRLVDLLSKRRTRNLTRPRQIAMALTREITNRSLPEIGAAFGGKDHTTVIYACRIIDDLKKKDPVLNNDYRTLRQILRN